MKQYLLAASLAACMHAGWAQAQAPAQPASAGAAPAAKAPAKAPSNGKAKAPLARSAQKAVEEVTPVDDDPKVVLTDADLEVARKVYVGDMKCELGASVRVRPARREGLFMISTRHMRYLMHPVESRTGAIRLEDPRRGAMWLQLGNKSMLMSQKLGQRIADECQSPEQVTAAEVLRHNPPPSLLEPMPHGRMAGEGAGAMHRGPVAGPMDAQPVDAPGTGSAPPQPPTAEAPAAPAAPTTGNPTPNN